MCRYYNQYAGVIVEILLLVYFRDVRAGCLIFKPLGMLGSFLSRLPPNYKRLTKTEVIMHKTKTRVCDRKPTYVHVRKFVKPTKDQVSGSVWMYAE